MALNRRLTSGLAWAGLLLVVGVPSADFITGAINPRASVTSEAPVPQVRTSQPKPAPIVTASKPAEQPAKAPTAKPPAAKPPVGKPEVAETPVAKPVSQAVAPPAQKPAAVASGDPVDKFISGGKKLPSYISGGDEEAPATAAPQDQSPASTPDSDVATVDPIELIAPIPAPASQRPKPVERVVIVDDATVERQPVIPPAGFVGEEDLAGWESGSLADYLAQQGLLSDGPSSAYDPDGFYLDEGPNGN